MVPHLITALTGPINELEQRIIDSMPAIERWFRMEWMEHTPPFYSSVDIRNAGFKLAPVDMNLFPGGFNNLNPAFQPLCVQATMAAIGAAAGAAKLMGLDQHAIAVGGGHWRRSGRTDGGRGFGSTRRQCGRL